MFCSPKNNKTIIEIGKYGKPLVDFHFLKSSSLDKPIARFQGKGNACVEKQRYDQKKKCVYINPDQYFEGIDQDVWEYQIGGYQVMDKWLKDRNKRILSLEEIQHYCRVATALKKTIEIQIKIDEIYPKVEKELLLIRLN